MSSIKMVFKVNDDDLRNQFFAEVLPAAIGSIEKDTTPIWGKMSAQHMVEHLLQLFEISTRKLQVKCSTSTEIQERFTAFLHTNQPMPKGFKSPLLGNDLAALKYNNLGKAVERLKTEIQDFIAYYKENPDIICLHPVFGELNAEEWHKLHFKHCLHHLLQFGLIEIMEKK